MLAPYEVKVPLHRLKRLGFVSDDGQATKLGHVVSGDFLAIDEAVQIVESVKKGLPPLDIVLKLHVLTAVYLNDVQRMAQALGANMSPNVFSGGNLEMFFSGSGDELTHLDEKAYESVIAFSIAFIDCDCDESPFCGCPERSFSKWVIERRMSGCDPADIVEQMSAFGVHAYSGDILNYLDQTVRLMESIEAMATILRKNDIARQALQIKLQLEG
jgi:helicase